MTASTAGPLKREGSARDREDPSMQLELIDTLGGALLRGDAHTASWLTALMVLVTLAAPPAYAAFALLDGDRSTSATHLAVVLSAGLLALVVQSLVGRLRPAAFDPMVAILNPYGFFSGHAAIAFASATFSALARRRGAGSALALFSLSTLVAVSRVFVGAHFPTDVIMGAVAGASLGALAYGLRFADNVARPRWSWVVWPQLALVVFASMGAYLDITHFAALEVAGADKLAHFVLFGAAAFLVLAWVPTWPRGAVIAAIVFATTVDEGLQALAPSRTFDLRDLACSLLGVLLATWVATRVLRGWQPQPLGRPHILRSLRAAWREIGT